MPRRTDAGLPSVTEATDSYTSWLRDQVAVVDRDLDEKRRRIRKSPFAFLRGTYYRWLQILPRLIPETAGPEIPIVGDLHLENFGTWRDAEGRLVWGVNDFDESETLPYTYDLVRLATSIRLAAKEPKVKIDADAAAEAMRAGYAEMLDGEGRPFVLAGDHRRVAGLVRDQLPSPRAWWDDQLPKGKTKRCELPESARLALAKVMPDPNWSFKAYPSVRGVGSLGRPRYQLLGKTHGAWVAREVKQVAPPAGRWLGRPASPGALAGGGIVRVPDPLFASAGDWLARRLSPDCIKLEMEHVRAVVTQRRLFTAMGGEVANIHLGAGPDNVARIRRHLKTLEPGWLQDTADRLASRTRRDWTAYREAT
jgi:hypothetical protein